MCPGKVPRDRICPPCQRNATNCSVDVDVDDVKVVRQCAPSWYQSSVSQTGFGVGAPESDTVVSQTTWSSAR